MSDYKVGSDRLAIDLQDVIEEVQQQAAAEGAFGRGTSRYTDLARPDLPLPAGAAWSTVKIKSVLHSCILNPVNLHMVLTRRHVTYTVQPLQTTRCAAALYGASQ